MMNPVLETENIQVFYGAVRALRRVSFHVVQGGIVSVIGANGAGKSTLLKAVAGIVRRPAEKFDLRANRYKASPRLPLSKRGFPWFLKVGSCLPV